MLSRKLRTLSNDAIDSRLRELDEVERSNLLEFVFLLAEMGRRDLHLCLGFNSLFAYCVDGLCLEKSFAYRRSTAAQLILRFPVITSYLRDGRLSVTTLVPLRKVLKPENYLKTLDQAAGLSEAKVKRLAAALAPRKVTRDVERRLPPARTVDLAEFGFSAETTSPKHDGARALVHATVPVLSSATFAGSTDSSTAALPFIATRAVAVRVDPGLPDMADGAGVSTAAVGFGETRVDQRLHATIDGEGVVTAPAVGLRETGVDPQLRHHGDRGTAAGAGVCAAQGTALVALPPPGPRIEPLCAEYTRIAFTADAEFMSLLATTRSALSHVVPDGGLLEVFRRAMALALDQSRRRKVGLRPTPTTTESAEFDQPESSAPRRRSMVAADSVSVLKPTATGGGPKRDVDAGAAGDGGDADEACAASLKARAAPADRYVPADVRVAVWRRDGGCCAFTGYDGHRCGSDWQVEFAHVVSFARGGPATISNMALRCRAHNQHEARVEFGDAFMRRFSGRTPAKD